MDASNKQLVDLAIENGASVAWAKNEDMHDLIEFTPPQLAAFASALRIETCEQINKEKFL